MRKKEISIPNCPQVYRVMEIHENGVEKPSNKFRVRKRFKDENTNKWTTQVHTFDDFGAAKRFAKSKTKVASRVGPSSEHCFKDVFERFFAHKVKRQMRRGSLDGLRSRAIHLEFFEPLLMTSINPKTVDRWLQLLYDDSYRQLHKSNRINYHHEYGLLNNIISYYRSYENENFVSPLLPRHREIACARPRDKQHQQLHFLNEEEEIGFLDSLSLTETFHDLAFLQLNTGLRIGEAAALKFKNVDFKRSEIYVCQHLDWPRRKGASIVSLPGTKTGANRWVPLTAACREMLLKRRRTSQSELVFPNSKGAGGWLAYRQIQYVFDRAFSKVSESLKGSHTLRHTFAVRYLNQTKDIYALQRLLGHASLEETQVYAKYSNESVRKSFELFKGGKAIEVVPSAVPKNVCALSRGVSTGS